MADNRNRVCAGWLDPGLVFPVLGLVGMALVYLAR